MPSRYSLSPVKPSEPGRLVALAFADELSAFSLSELLSQMEEDGVLEIGDAVVATRNAKGKVRLHQSMPLVATGAMLGSFGGFLIGLFLLNPLFGSVAGLAVGAASAACSDFGIDDAFMKSLGETLTPGSSALFVVVRHTKPEQIIQRLQPFAGRCQVLQTTLTPENEATLRGLLEGEISRIQAELTQAADSTPPPQP